MIHWIHQNKAPWYLFNFITKKVGSINIALEYLPLEITGKRLRKKKALFNCLDRY